MACNMTILGLAAWICLFAGTAKGEGLPVGAFSTSGLEGWEEEVFSGKTSYRLVSMDGRRVLRAESRNSASVLTKKVQVDITKYPYLHWRWRVERPLDIENERVKEGDDYAARIYVVVSGGAAFWRSKAVNYVWAHAASKGEVWNNAFAGENVRMMALRSRRDRPSTWYSEKRNVYEDFKALFGTAFRGIDALALMTDTDNSHLQAEAYYGDITFSMD